MRSQPFKPPYMLAWLTSAACQKGCIQFTHAASQPETHRTLNARSVHIICFERRSDLALAVSHIDLLRQDDIACLHLACSSHLQVSLSDPSIGDKFSVEKLGTTGRGLVSVPSIVHGAPETAEVCMLAIHKCYTHVLQHSTSLGIYVKLYVKLTCMLIICAECNCMPQESRETLFRLQRMAGFESQNFDPQVPSQWFCLHFNATHMQALP